MTANSIIRPAAVILFVFSVVIAKAESFKVSKISYVGDGLSFEVKTDLPDGSEVNLCITDDKNGFNCISSTKSFTVNRGRFVADDFSTDLNDAPFRPGHYWLSIAKGTNILPRAAVLPITVPKRSKQQSISKATPTETGDTDAARSESAGPAVSQVEPSWVDDVLRIIGKTDLPDGTWLNIAIEDEDGLLIAEEGFICTPVRGGQFVVEGFTKDGIRALPPGRYKLSIELQNPVQSGFGFSAKKTIRVTRRPSFTKSRIAAVRAVNAANYANARDNAAAATKSEDVSDFQRGLSNTLLRHQAIKNTVDELTSSGSLRLECNKGKAWIDPGLWQSSDAEDKENLSRAIYETCSSQSIDIYDAQSAKKLARYGSVLGFRAY